jgi:hypothetical protein
MESLRKLTLGVSPHGTSGGPNLGLNLFPCLVQDIAKDDFGTFTHKKLRLSSALSPRSTANQRDFPIEPAHRCLLSISTAP